ncbi:MAG: hypothetical protein AAF388_07685 [Bacteroidota bacterium]
MVNYREEMINSPLKVVKMLKNIVDKRGSEYESLINLESRQVSLRKEKREATLSYQEIDIQQNKINSGILDVIKAIEENPKAPIINSGKGFIYNKNKYTRGIVIVLSCGTFLFFASILLGSYTNLIYAPILPIIIAISSLIYFYREVILLFTNNYALITRRRKYYKAKAKNPDRKKILSEGDSWFCYPFVNDVTDYLSNYYNVFSLAEAYDEAQTILRDGDLFAFAEIEKPDVVLLSAGGNEISIKFRIRFFIRHTREGHFLQII